jgi:hypothetical protein
MATQSQEQRVAEAAGPQNVKAQQSSTAMNAKVAAAAPPAPRK